MANDNEVVFIKRPIFENKKLLINLSKNYIESEILLDSTEVFYGHKKNEANTGKRLKDFPEELDFSAQKKERPQREKEIDSKMGYCIRSGESIPFNLKQPMSKGSWRKWNEYKNPDYRETYCHKTGKKSNGKTSMNKPVLDA